MTAQELIEFTLQDINVMAPGETISNSDLTYCLGKLNHLLASWSAQALPIPEITRESFSVSGAEFYSIGTGMNWNTARPIKIKAAASVNSDHSEPLEIVTAEDWARIDDKSLAGKWAKRMYYDNGHPTGFVYLWPRPAAGGTVQVDSYKELTTLAALGTTVAFPPGYERALITSLAPEVAGGFQKQVTEAMVGLANDAKTSIFGLNQSILGHPGGQQAQGAPVAPVAQ